MPGKYRYPSFPPSREYKSLGGEPQPPQLLDRLLDEHRRRTNTVDATAIGAVAVIHGFICLDIAQNTSNTREIPDLIAESRDRFQFAFTTVDEAVRNQEFQLLQSGLMLSLLPKYQKVLIDGAQPDTQDERKMFRNLLAVAGSPQLKEYRAHTSQEHRSYTAQARTALMLHTLNARSNLLFGEMLEHSWPALPRQALKRNDAYNFWDISVSPRAFLAPEFFKIRATRGEVPLRPLSQPHDLKNISFDRDLMLSGSPTDTINHLLVEEMFSHRSLSTTEGNLLSRAKSELNRASMSWFTKLGWAIDDTRQYMYQVTNPAHTVVIPVPDF